jgi:hypothetical protein
VTQAFLRHLSAGRRLGRQVLHSEPRGQRPASVSVAPILGRFCRKARRRHGVASSGVTRWNLGVPHCSPPELSIYSPRLRSLRLPYASLFPFGLTHSPVLPLSALPCSKPIRLSPLPSPLPMRLSACRLTLYVYPGTWCVRHLGGVRDAGSGRASWTKVAGWHGSSERPKTSKVASTIEGRAQTDGTPQTPK